MMSSLGPIYTKTDYRQQLDIDPIIALGYS